MTPDAFARITDNRNSKFSGNVLIIGAGAAGLSTGHLLEQRGIDFNILESSPTYGGRMKRTNTFGDNAYIMTLFALKIPTLTFWAYLLLVNRRCNTKHFLDSSYEMKAT